MRTLTRIQKPCAVCGSKCPPSHGQKPLKYCSEPCKERGQNDKRNERRHAARAAGRLAL